MIGALYLSISWIIVGLIVKSEAQLEPYYGVQVGEFGDSKVYAADSKTLLIVGQEARKVDEAQCTSFIGSLIDRRVKRQQLQLKPQNFVPQIQALNPNRHPLDWAFEFGHLRVEDGADSGAGAGAASQSAHKIQDPFDVQLSKDSDEDDSRNASHSLLSITPDQSTPALGITSGQNATSIAPESNLTVVVTTPESSPKSTSRVRTVSASISKIDEAKSSTTGPRLTLPPVRKTTQQPSGQGSSSQPSGQAPSAHNSTIPTIVLNSFVLHSGVTTGDLEYENATELPATTGQPQSPEVTTQANPMDDGSSEEPPPISGGTEDVASFESAETSATLPPERKALWSRPTVDPTTTDGASVSLEAESAEGEAGNSTEVATTRSGTSGHSSTARKGKKERLPSTTDSTSTNHKATKEPKPSDHTNSGSGISWGDQPKPDPNVPKHKPSDTAQAASTSNQQQPASGGIIWLGANAPTTLQPENQAPGQHLSPGQSTFYPPGKPGRNTGKPVSVLRQLPVEYFGGLNVPDELEGKASVNGTVAGVREEVEVPHGGPAAVARGQSGGSAVASQGDQGVYTIQLGGTRKTTLSPPQPETTQQTQQAQHTFYRGSPPSPPSPPAPPAAPGAQPIPNLPSGPFGNAPVPTAPARTQDGTQSAKNATERTFVDAGDEVDCGGKAWCVVADPHQRRSRPIAQPTTPPPTQASDSAWYVIEDRRAHGRDSAPQAGPGQDSRHKRQIAQKVNLKKPYQKIPKNPATFVAQPIPGTKRGNQVYLLPRFDANKVTVRMPEPYQLSDFESIGIYDQCRRVRLANIKLRKLDAPKEALLPGLRGWQYQIGSSEVRILNCNSILVKNFTFNGGDKTEASFFVGTGAYPFNVYKKFPATVIGQAQNQPLTNYKNQDILVRLPSGVRTIDITWLAVQTAKGTSLAHLIIPPVLVPPCDI